jgi:hypothetical protein
MARTRIELPAALADWIDAKIGLRGGVRSVRILSCDRLPFDWLPGDRSKFSGIVLFGTVYLRKRIVIDPADHSVIHLLLHELIHIRQFQTRSFFALRYVARLARHGYWNHPAEIEARDESEKLMQRYSIERPCG